MAPKLSKKLWQGARCLKTPTANTSYARLHSWNKGVFWAVSVVNIPQEQIAEIVAKPDGELPSLRASDEVIAHNADFTAKIAYTYESKKAKSHTTGLATDPRLPHD